MTKFVPTRHWHREDALLGAWEEVLWILSRADSATCKEVAWGRIHHPYTHHSRECKGRCGRLHPRSEGVRGHH